MFEFKKIPKKYHPKGYHILYEDHDLLVGNKSPGILSVKANWNREHTIHFALNQYVRKGNSKSRKCVFVVHRLDQDTSGVLIFAKSYEVQRALKENWKDTLKTYYAIVQGRLEKKTGTVSSYLMEDDDYVVHSTDKHSKGKLSHTQWEVLKEEGRLSLLKINLLTGRKNQIRVHLSDIGHPVLGDSKYGPNNTKYRNLFLHAYSISFKHPKTQQTIDVKADVPDHFKNLIDYSY